MKALNIITGALIVIGALNWGLVALAEFDLVAFVVGLGFGETNILSRIIYALVGISGLYQIGMFLSHSRHHHHQPAQA